MEGTYTVDPSTHISTEHFGWDDHKDSILRVVIGEGITSVCGFDGCVNLAAVELPQSVTLIESGAFGGCTGLQAIDLPTATPLGISSNAFSASGLKEIVLPDNVTSVGTGAFSSCLSLTYARLSNGMSDRLKPSVFANCTSLAEVDFGTAVTSIGESAFYNTGFKELVIPDHIISIHSKAFGHCWSLETLDIGDGVQYIWESGFAHCKALRSVTLGSGLESMKRNAFVSCDAIEELHINDLEHWLTMTDIGIDASPQYADRLYVNGVLLEDLVIPETVTKVTNRYAFAGVGSLKKLTIPDHVTSFGGFSYCENLTEVIVGSGVEYIYDGVFHRCTGLETVIFRGSAPEFVDGTNFYKCSATCYYPAGDPTWTEEIMYFPAATLTWVPYDRELGVGNPFTDVPWDSFFYESVMWAAEKGITNGLTETSFGPGGSCNRAQVVTFLWRAAGEPEPTTTENPFVDVQAGSFYEKAVLWAVENGITTGTDATHFSPNMACNRATVVTFLYRAFEEPAVEGAENPFTDVPADSWYTAPVLWAVEQGITNGMGEGIFGSETACNRAQIVTFLYRAYTE
ncbi:MAG: leucine-rich repeat protein [Oscillospiraceae bacterium]|nr:leucine-rich repeat protein [Oscillospiraceae bacterium]